MLRYYFWLLVAIGLLIGIIILFFIPGGKKLPTAKSLSSYASTNAAAELSIDGPVVSQQKHSLIKISVNNNEVVYTQYVGYDGQIVDRRTYTNTNNSYLVFLKALAHYGFTLGDNNKALSDERGYCATGNRYIFDFKQGDSLIERYWTTNCSGTKTFLGNFNICLTLFEKQVPDFDKISQFLSI